MSAPVPAPLPERARRIVYMGTPAIAVPPLAALIKAGFEIVGVVTGPDRRRGRGGATSPTPVKALALEHGLDVHHDLGVVESLGADLGVVVAYGSIISTDLLARVPMVNIHFSLLPRWRGAAPVERAILAGDEATGVCIMQVEEGLDTGGVLATSETAINDRVTAAELSARLAELGADLLVDTLSGPLPAPVPQTGNATYARKIGPADLELVWALPADDLARRVRLGRAWTVEGGSRLRVVEARARSASPDDPPPGLVAAGPGGQIVVGTGHGTLELLAVVPEGRAHQVADAWFRRRSAASGGAPLRLGA